MKIMILGGDGFCGWPTSLHLSSRGHEVLIVDNLSRRKIDIELEVESLTPIRPVGERLRAWKQVSGREIGFVNLDLALQYRRLLDLLRDFQPDAIVHFAEQRAAPYSMRSPETKRYTVDNNVRGTHNLLCALVDSGVDSAVVHLGTMGVYGYGWSGSAPIPEGYLAVKVPTPDGDLVREILHPANPGSVYHMTKTLDQLLFAFYAKNDGVRITDLHQGIVWGTQTPQTVLDERLINRFDYDGDYGTVLNRFLMQAAIGHPLTVHGTGGQTRAFIHIRDTVRCIEIAINNPPASGDRVSVFNQTTEVHRVIDLANLVSQMTGAQVVKLPNPRKEAPENDLVVRNDRFLALGLNPTTLSEGLLEEVTQIAGKYKDRVDTSKIVARSVWVKGMAVAPDLQLSPTSDRGVVSADEAVEQIGPTMLEGVEELAGETNGSSSRGDARAAGGGTTGKASVPGNGAGNPRPARGQADRR
jgi:UDP-sulfoquinovose synthase